MLKVPIVSNSVNQLQCGYGTNTFNLRGKPTTLVNVQMYTPKTNIDNGTLTSTAAADVRADQFNQMHDK
jgi:hypothetical protein